MWRNANCELLDGIHDLSSKVAALKVYLKNKNILKPIEAKDYGRTESRPQKLSSFWVKSRSEHGWQKFSAFKPIQQTSMNPKRSSTVQTL
jgi:hypothetical protein